MTSPNFKDDEIKEIPKIPLGILTAAADKQLVVFIGTGYEVRQIKNMIS